MTRHTDANPGTNSRPFRSTLQARRRQGITTKDLLLVLVLALVAGGGWNYYRNWQNEAVAKDSQPRPFADYAEADLKQLADGYQAEIDAWERRNSAAQRVRVEAQDRGTVEKNIGEFARVREASDRVRDIHTEIGQRQARLREIRAEQRRRSRDVAVGLDLHIKRLTTL
jgi:hypothetical protein